MKSLSDTQPVLAKLTTIFCILILISLCFTTEAFAKKPNLKKHPKIKNLIIMISDGAGYNQVDAASLYQYGMTGVQVYEDFPVKLGMSTYEFDGGYDTDSAWSDFDYVNSGATDSAAAATTMSTGVKTDGGNIGVDYTDLNDLTHIMEWAETYGKMTGVVSSVEFSHATPAAFIAHNVSRNNYAEIANEMIYESAADVIMGCGAPDFDNDGEKSSKTTKYVGGPETWEDLTDDFRVIGADADGDSAADEWTVIRSREEFLELMEGETPERVIGIPYVYQTLQYNRSGDFHADPYMVSLIETVPTLEEMTKAALNVLDQDEDGFVLMVEGGAVDWAGHGNSSGRVIEEEIDFNHSVEAVVAWIEQYSNWGETLLIVTGDHETGYLTGPDGGLTLGNNGAFAVPEMEWHSGSHTNQIIPFFAKGARANEYKKLADEVDMVRGRYIDNTEIVDVVLKDWGIEP